MAQRLSETGAKGYAGQLHVLDNAGEAKGAEYHSVPRHIRIRYISDVCHKGRLKMLVKYPCCTSRWFEPLNQLNPTGDIEESWDH